MSIDRALPVGLILNETAMNSIKHVHSVLEMLPLTGLLLVIALHWTAFIALFGFGQAKFTFTLKQEPLPATYVVTMLILTGLFQIIPYLEELIRGLRNRSRQSQG